MQDRTHVRANLGARQIRLLEELCRTFSFMTWGATSPSHMKSKVVAEALEVLAQRHGVIIND